jgi:hypothetical protein
MVLFDMKSTHSPEDVRRVLNKLTWFSGVLRDVDDWLDSTEEPAKPRTALTFENLDHHISQEKDARFG